MKLHCSWTGCKTIVTLTEEQEDQKRFVEEGVGKMFGAAYGVMCEFHQKVMNEKNHAFRKKYGAAWPNEMNKLYSNDKKAYNKIVNMAIKKVRKTIAL